MKIVAISDVHGKWNKIKDIPECDVLISAGDYSFRGEEHMVKDFHKWLSKQKAKHVISVQGNHELWVESNFEAAKAVAEKACPGVHFIGDHGTVVIDGVKFHGSAYTPWFHNWAWNKQRGIELAQEWAKIPEDTNVLITHGPVAGILDLVLHVDGSPKERVGCHDLLAKIVTLDQLKYHICGHIHSGYGEYNFHGKKFINASICDEMYMPTNPITVFEY